MIFEEAVAGLGYRGNVKIAVSEAYPSPVSVGFFHPIILLPRATLNLSETELRFVIRHELTHYLRGDIGKDRALEVLQCIFWWNPVVYYLRRSVVEMLELECDERVCRGMSEEEQLVYFEAIHRVLKFSPRRGIGLGMSFASSHHNGEFLTRRFLEILKPVPKYSRIVTGFLAVVSIILFCLSYSFILQPAQWPTEVEKKQFDHGQELEVETEPVDFLIKLSDGSYLYVVDLVGKEIITEEDLVNNSLYSGLPIYEEKSEGREQ
jgi:beta-lactamase regulating signal transducer with metallopeptidase domain